MNSKDSQTSIIQNTNPIILIISNMYSVSEEGYPEVRVYCENKQDIFVSTQITLEQKVTITLDK